LDLRENFCQNYVCGEERTYEILEVTPGSVDLDIFGRFFNTAVGLRQAMKLMVQAKACFALV